MTKSNRPEPDHSDASRDILDAISKAPRFNRWMYSRIAEYCSGKILEVGSGIGNLSELILNEHPTATLSDISNEYCRYLHKRFERSSSPPTVLQLDFADPLLIERHIELRGEFDTIVAFNVLEHIADEHLALVTMAELLKPGGRIVLLCPWGRALFNSLDEVLEHCRRYTDYSLLKAVTDAGFHKSVLTHFNAFGLVAWWLFGSLLKRDRIGTTSMRMYDLIVPLIRPLDKLVLHSIGLSVIVVAERNS